MATRSGDTALDGERRQKTSRQKTQDRRKNFAVSCFSDLVSSSLLSWIFAFHPKRRGAGASRRNPRAAAPPGSLVQILPGRVELLRGVALEDIRALRFVFLRVARHFGGRNDRLRIIHPAVVIGSAQAGGDIPWLIRVARTMTAPPNNYGVFLDGLNSLSYRFGSPPGKAFPLPPATREMQSDAVEPLVKEVMEGTKTAQQALQEMRSKAEPIMARYR